MQWTTGYHPFIATGRSIERPRKSFLASENIWTVETPPVQTARNSTTTIIVVGSCYASTEQLQEALAHAEYDKWYEVARWPGSYIAIVQRKDATFVLGTLSGAARIYYGVSQQGIWWASAATPLAALLGKKPNFNQLLFDLTVEGTDLYGGKSVFDDIEAIPPGSLLRLPRDGQYTVEQWYTPQLNVSFEETAHRLHDALHHSLDSRARTSLPVASDFSGGLDSGTITLLLAASREVQGLTYIDPWIQSDDIVYARELARKASRLQHKIVQGGDKETPYSNLAAAHDITDLPAHDIFLSGRNNARLQAIVKYGARHHLIGEGGDEILAPGVARIADMYLDGYRAEPKKEVVRLARRYTMPPRKLKRDLRETVRLSYAESLHELAGAIKRGQPLHQPRIRWCGTNEALSWLTVDTQQELAWQLSQLANETADSLPPETLRNWQYVRKTAVSQLYTQTHSARYGVTLDYPFLDTEVVHTCLSLSSYKKVRKGVFKPLLTAAFGNELPKLLLQRTTKGSFGGTIYRGLRINQEEIQKVVQSSQLAASGKVNIERIFDVIDQAALGLQAPLGQLDVFIATELWLSSLDIRKEKWWEDNIVSS